MNGCETAFESADSECSSHLKCRDLPLFEPSIPTSDDHGRRTYRQSIRLRPSQLLVQHNAEPPLPLKDYAPGPELRSRGSRMSLFGLFSKPKVEKTRGYSEQGLAAPPSLFTKHGNASGSNVGVQAQPKNAVRDAPPRTPSAMSFFSNAARSTAKSDVKDAAIQVTPQGSKGSFVPPPLFQAYPQSRKHGALKVSATTMETVLQKAKSRIAGGSQSASASLSPSNVADDGTSAETRRTAKTTARYVVDVTSGHTDLPRKIIVLVTSGYLLQYEETGPSDRLPEKVLHLGKDSAAFASDLVPGKHYVLQVSSAVDQHGITVANSGSIFAKFGLRSSAAKRMAADMLLVMPSAEEMNAWMVVIRQEIESLGGSPVISDTAVRPTMERAADSYHELKQTPSNSHRYQVRREPSKPNLTSKPSVEAIKSLPPPSPSGTKEVDEPATPQSMDGVEEEEELELDEDEEAEQASDRVETSPLKPQHDPDTQSLRSSTVVSFEQQRLNSLRSSNRMSHSTVATTVATSRTNSLSGSPPSDQASKGSSETSRDAIQMKSTYRTLSSYAMLRRRSAMPVQKEPASPNIDSFPQVPRHSTTDATLESSVSGCNSPMPPTPMSPRKIDTAVSEPNPRAAAVTKAKRDSKMPSPPNLREESERPESFLGDLPPPSRWASERSPCRKSFALAAAAQHTSSRTGESTVQPPKRSPRQSAQPFSLPLKINPSTPANRPPSRHENRGSFNNLEPAGDEPTVYTLTAKIDANKRPSVSPVQISSRSPSSPHPMRTPSGRLSLFPAQLPSPQIGPPLVHGPIKRSPSATVQSSQGQAQTNGNALKRPTSMQVRSDHAPFLQSVRTSTIGPLPANGRSFTAPIRSLKPSRSSSVATTQPAAQDPVTVPDSTSESPTLPEYEAVGATPLPERALSPPPSRPSSRTGGKKLKMRASLPVLDLGMPVVGLGPPAPPPQAPLPAPPETARCTSPLPPDTRAGIMA